MHSVTRRTAAWLTTTTTRVQLLESGQNFAINQFGLSAFTLTDTGYVAKTFNFNIFPRSFRNIEKVFTCQASSLEYLAKHNFDFNKVVYHGIPFLPLEDQGRLLKVRPPVRSGCFLAVFQLFLGVSAS